MSTNGGLDRSALLLLLATAASFAASPALNKALVTALDPLTLAFLRAVIAAPLMWVIVFADPRARAGRVGLGEAALLGFLLVVIPFVAMAWGLQRIASGLGGILYGAMPLFTAAFAWLFLRGERLGVVGLIGLLFGLVGVVLVIGVDVLIDGVGRNVAGEMVTLLAPLSYALGVIVLRRMGTLQPLRLTAAMLGISAVALAPAAVLISPDLLMALSARQWFALVALATAATALPAWLNQRLVATAGAVNASLAMFVMPPLAVIYGWFAFGERLGAGALVGMVMIVAAGLLVTRARRL